MVEPDVWIAVVDDDSPVRTMLARVLAQAQYRACGYASGEEFLASLGVRLPACAIIDVQMPGLSGFEVRARMRAANVLVPVVFITGRDGMALDASMRDAGVEQLLQKPFSSDALLDALDRATGRTRAALGGKV
ncbi:response regulator [Variovorax robiniae]|uniref:Response regulator n=1 Tax=Variovorax robiniae TaxID=1836199 RepID=A0ABU8XJ17_9BURK